MKARSTLATLALAAAFGTADAARVLEQPERPYELTLEQLTLPSSAAGGITVKPCEDCTYSTHVLTAATQFLLNGQLVPFVDFSRVFEEVRGNSRASATAVAGLFVDVDTGRVTRVSLRYRGL
jgi:hypothetical protein